MKSFSLPTSGSNRLVSSDRHQTVTDVVTSDRTKRFNTILQRWFVAGLLAFFILLSIQYSYKAVAGRSAFLRWRSQIEQLDDVDIYQRFKYPNPPIMALLLERLVRLPPLAGSLAWFYLKVGMVLLSFYWVFHLVESKGAPFPPWAKGLTVLLSLRPIMGDLYHNNVNIFILFLLTGSLFAFCRGRRVTSGVILGLAIACKVTPALFIPYFLWKRAWGALIGCSLGLILFLLIVPGLCLGMDRNLVLLSSWEKQMIEPFVVNGAVASEHNNQSLPGLAYRLATYSPSFSKFDYDLWNYTPLEYHNWLALNPKTVQWFLKACMAVFAIMVIWICRTPLRGARDEGPGAREQRRGAREELPAFSLLAPRPSTLAPHHWPLAAEFSLIVLGMLLFSERTWKHHCVTLLLPFAVILYYLAVERPKPGIRWFLISILAAVTLLMASTSTNGLFSWWDHGAKMAQVYGAYVWAYGLLILGIVVILRQQSSNVKPVPDAPQIMACRVSLENTATSMISSFSQPIPTSFSRDANAELDHRAPHSRRG
jgi:hypothetical protein